MGAALAIEWIHNFTLIHDDIQDVSRERRHRPSVWSVWGSAQAINAGDGLFAVGFNSLLEGDGPPSRRLRAAQVITAAVMEVIQGQCLDLASEGLPQTPPQRYMKLISAKTGALVGAAMEAGAVMAGAPAPVRKGVRRAGRFLGLAFQVRDDWLGVWGDPELTGKSRDGDLAQRKLSHPVVAAYAVADRSQRSVFRRLFLDRKPGGEAQIRQLLEDLGGPGLTVAAPGELARAAVSAFRQAGMTEQAVEEFAQVARYAAERTG
jgi:geranylgeranyl diphosphate synthase type I